MCPVRAKIVRKLTSSEFHLQHFPHPHKVQEWTGFIKSQLTKDPHLITTTARQDKKHGELEGKFQSPRDRGLRRSTLGTKHLIVGFMFLTFIAVYMSIIQEMLVVSILLRLGVLLIALLL